MATSPTRPIRLRILGGTGVTNYPNELLADITNKKLTLYDADGGNTIDFYSELESAVSGSGNAITALSVSGRKITVTKGSTFLTAHPSITKSTDSTSTGKPTHGGTFTAIDSVTRDTNGHVTKVNTKTVTLPSETSLSIETDSTANSGNAITAISVSGHKITLKKESTFLTAHPSVTKSTDGTSTASPSHGGTFTAIDTITRDTFGHVTKINTKTVTLPGETALSLGAVSGSGNAVTGVTVSGHQITLVKGSTFLTAHPSVTTATDGTSTAAPAHGETFTAIDSVTRDTFGHVTKVNTKTVTLPSETDLSLGTVSGTGNAVTSITVKGHEITLVKGSTFLTAHPTITKSTDSTNTATPAVNGSFTAIDSVTRDTNGHVTKVNTKTVSLANVNTAIAAKATTVLYTGTIGTSWSGSSAPYTQSVSISGILATDTPIVDINFNSVTYANKEAVTTAWGSIYRITTAANSITVYADEKTTTSVPIQLKVVR